MTDNEVTPEGNRGRIPDPVPITEAAQARGVSRDVVYNWVKNGWISSRKTANVRTAPILVSMSEVLAFESPRRGWPRGVSRCPACGGALVEGHWCEGLRRAASKKSPTGKAGSPRGTQHDLY